MLTNPCDIKILLKIPFCFHNNYPNNILQKEFSSEWLAMHEEKAEELGKFIDEF